MSERESEAGAGGTGEAGGVPGNPYAEMSGLNAEIARQRAAEAEDAGVEAQVAAAAATGAPYAEMQGLNAEAARRRAAEPVTEAAVAAPAAPAAAGRGTAGRGAAAPAMAAAGTGGGSGGSGGSASGGSGGGGSGGGGSGGGGSSLVLVLLALLVGALAALLARPYLPEEVAAYLSPGDAALEAEVESLRAELASVREVEGSLGALRARVEEIATVKSALLEETAADDLTKEGIKIALGEIWDRVEALETGIQSGQTALGEEAAERQRLAASLSEIGAKVTALETAEQAVAALTERLGSVEAAAATDEELAAVGARIAALESELAAARDRVAAAEAAAAAGAVEAKEAMARSRLRANAAELRLDLRTGTSFTEVLDRLETEAGVAAPAELREAAEGVATPAALEEDFPARAQAAVKADVLAQEETDTAAGQVSAWFKAQVTGRPVEAQEGEGVPATLSRMGKALEAGDAVEAHREAETLPDHAKEALGPWLGQLRARAEAEAALDRWLAEIGATDS